MPATPQSRLPFDSEGAAGDIRSEISLHPALCLAIAALIPARHSPEESRTLSPSNGRNLHSIPTRVRPTSERLPDHRESSSDSPGAAWSNRHQKKVWAVDWGPE